MSASFKPTEGLSQGRCFSRKIRRDSYQAQIDKLPNEFRDAFVGYNHKCSGWGDQIDENQYYLI